MGAAVARQVRRCHSNHPSSAGRLACMMVRVIYKHDAAQRHTCTNIRLRARIAIHMHAHENEQDCTDIWGPSFLNSSFATEFGPAWVKFRPNSPPKVAAVKFVRPSLGARAAPRGPTFRGPGRTLAGVGPNSVEIEQAWTEVGLMWPE